MDAAPLSLEARTLRHLRNDAQSKARFSNYLSTESVCLSAFTCIKRNSNDCLRSTEIGFFEMHVYTLPQIKLIRTGL